MADRTPEPIHILLLRAGRNFCYAISLVFFAGVVGAVLAGQVSAASGVALSLIALGGGAVGFVQHIALWANGYTRDE